MRARPPQNRPQIRPRPTNLVVLHNHTVPADGGQPLIVDVLVRGHGGLAGLLDPLVLGPDERGLHRRKERRVPPCRSHHPFGLEIDRVAGPGGVRAVGGAVSPQQDADHLDVVVRGPHRDDVELVNPKLRLRTDELEHKRNLLAELVSVVRLLHLGGKVLETAVVDAVLPERVANALRPQKAMRGVGGGGDLGSGQQIQYACGAETLPGSQRLGISPQAERVAGCWPHVALPGTSPRA